HGDRGLALEDQVEAPALLALDRDRRPLTEVHLLGLFGNGPELPLGEAAEQLALAQQLDQRILLRHRAKDTPRLYRRSVAADAPFLLACRGRPPPWTPVWF